MPVFNGVGTSYNDTSENYGAYAFTTLDTSADKSGTTYDYVFLGRPDDGQRISSARTRALRASTSPARSS